jgi:16S rRNA (cytidine1402-2'-O)-methyltransferase
MSKLYVIPTPIGNLEDITFRALRMLKEVDVILSEDTRQTGKLLKHYDVQNQLMPYHKFNEHKSLEKYIEILKEGKTIGLVSDAGTPSISDPGYLIVKACVDNDIPVECLPGATSIIPAIVNSGLPSDRFYFEGFLPHKKGRQTRIKNLCDKEQTVIILESPHRIIKLIDQLSDLAEPERKVTISREISKVYEETIRGTIAEVKEELADRKTIKGEIVVCLEGKSK